MIDPRDLIARYRIPYNPEEFEKFDGEYKKLIASLGELGKIFVHDTIITGTQYRLRGRSPELIMKFGVTSDKFILAKILGIKPSEVSDSVLSRIKDSLYEERKRVYIPDELKLKYSEICRDEEKS